MRFTCPSCAKSYRLPPERLGASGRARFSCPNCKAAVHVWPGQGEVLECELITGAEAGSGTVRASQLVAAQPVAAAAEAPAWFVAVGRDKQGPMTGAQLAQLVAAGKATAQSLVWRKGMTGWTKLAEVADLRRVLQGAAQPPAQPAAQAAQPGARQSQPQPARATAPVQPARSTAPQNAQPAQPAQTGRQTAPQAAAPRPAPQPKPAPAPVDLDDAGPTMEAALPLLKGGPAPAAKGHGAGHGASHGAKAPDVQAMQADAHGAAFFGSHDLGDVELQLPDPNKHKPTKEEYQNLLQEFSVMFRLDKRSKRQKVAIAASLGAALLGVVVFGVMLKIQADRKQELLRDSKTILAVFNLPYQTSVTVSFEDTEETQVAAAPGAPATPKKPSLKVEGSELSRRLLATTKKARKPKAAGTAAVARGPAQPQLSAAEEKALRDQQEQAIKAAMQRALTGPGGKVERVTMGNSIGAQEVSKAQLAAMCSAREPDLRGCAKQHIGGAGFKAVVTINQMGRVESVRAMVDGSADAALGSCARSRLASTNFGPQPKEVSHTCSVD